MATTLKHGAKCGGTLSPDVTHRFSFVSPGISATPDGVSLGVMEIKEIPGTSSLKFRCGKCQQSLAPEDDEKVIVTQCMFCRKNRPINSVWVSHPFYAVCETCKETLMGEREAESPEIAEIMSFYLVAKSSMKFVLLSDILKKAMI